MEDLEGILIATTNLTANLDKAFERRFLYKIKFEKPSQEAKKQIWKAMMPELSEADARYLASKFEFSGAQIENIVRKRPYRAFYMVPNHPEKNCSVIVARKREGQAQGQELVSKNVSL